MINADDRSDYSMPVNNCWIKIGIRGGQICTSLFYRIIEIQHSDHKKQKKLIVTVLKLIYIQFLSIIDLREDDKHLNYCTLLNLLSIQIMQDRKYTVCIQFL